MIRLAFLFTLLLTVLIIPHANAQEEQSWNDTTYFIPYDNDFNLIMSTSRGHLKNVRSLLERGADINAATIDGITPLMYATENGDMEMVRFLIEHGADPNIKPFNGITALMSAVRQNYFEIAEYLVNNGARINMQDEEGVTAVHYAAAFNYYEMVDMLIFYGADTEIADDAGNTPLLTASFNNCYEAADILLQNGANVNATDNKGFTPLMVAIQENNEEIAELLLEYEADIETENYGGMTPLAFAVREGNYSIAERLIELGADVNHSIAGTRNILELSKEMNHSEITDLLLVSNAQPNPMPHFQEMTIGTNFDFNLSDFMMGLDLGIHDVKYNFGINWGFNFRPGAVRTLYQESEKLYYQYWERRYFFYLELEKRFNINDPRDNFHSGPVLSLGEIFTFGNFRGSLKEPKSRFHTVPSAGWYFKNNILKFMIQYEFINFSAPELSPSRINATLSVNLPLQRRSHKNKEIDWLMN